MEQMALLQETAYERLYRWAQSKWCLSHALNSRMSVSHVFVSLGLSLISYFDFSYQKMFLKIFEHLSLCLCHEHLPSVRQYVDLRIGAKMMKSVLLDYSVNVSSRLEDFQVAWPSLLNYTTIL